MTFIQDGEYGYTFHRPSRSPSHPAVARLHPATQVSPIQSMSSSIHITRLESTYLELRIVEKHNDRRVVGDIEEDETPFEERIARVCYVSARQHKGGECRWEGDVPPGTRWTLCWM